MYENKNKRGINIDLPTFKLPKFNKKNSNDSKKTIFNIIFKFAVICLFFFIFIFCFSKFGKSIKPVEHEEKDFNTNLTYIKSTLLDYYNINNLPKINGDSTSYTISELIDKEILVKSNINKNEECDLKSSYVVITKTKNSIYNLKISLLCNDIEEVLEYDFKK